MPAQSMAAPICILGMHRSGTSCLAGALEAGGLFLGDVVQQAPHNRRGNREHLDIRALNDAVLTHNGASWDRPGPIATWPDRLAEQRDELIEVLGNKGQRRWGFKDPRTVLTLDFWRQGARFDLVGTFRHPLSVAASLASRGGVPMGSGLKLWHAYNSVIVREWDRRPFPIIRFDQAPDAYAKGLGALLSQLGFMPAGTAFFTSELVHQQTNVDSPLPAPIGQLWYDLLERAEQSMSAVV